MARYARISFPSGIFHIISIILRGEYLISGAEERLQYLRMLGRYGEHGWKKSQERDDRVRYNLQLVEEE